MSRLAVLENQQRYPAYTPGKTHTFDVYDEALGQDVPSRQTPAFGPNTHLLSVRISGNGGWQIKIGDDPVAVKYNDGDGDEYTYQLPRGFGLHQHPLIAVEPGQKLAAIPGGPPPFTGGAGGSYLHVTEME